MGYCCCQCCLSCSFSWNAFALLLWCLCQTTRHGVHWSRTAIAGALAIGQLMASLSSPVWSRLIDHFGPRPAILVSVIGMSIAYGSLAFLTQHLWQLYLVFAAFTILGGAASPVGYSTVLVRRFERHLGLALGLALMGIGLGAVVLPRIAEHLLKFAAGALHMALSVSPPFLSRSLQLPL